MLGVFHGCGGVTGAACPMQSSRIGPAEKLQRGPAWRVSRSMDSEATREVGGLEFLTSVHTKWGRWFLAKPPNH